MLPLPELLIHHLELSELAGMVFAQIEELIHVRNGELWARGIKLNSVFAGNVAFFIPGIHTIMLKVELYYRLTCLCNVRITGAPREQGRGPPESSF